MVNVTHKFGINLRFLPPMFEKQFSMKLRNCKLNKKIETLDNGKFKNVTNLPF